MKNTPGSSVYGRLEFEAKQYAAGRFGLVDEVMKRRAYCGVSATFDRVSG